MENIQTTGKRKSAVARATLYEGSGNVYINKKSLSVYEPKLARLKIREPLELAGDLSDQVNIRVKVNGGGYMGQADASRTAIAKALLEYADDKDLYEKFKEYDESLIKSDMRKKESKKPGGKGARKKRQKSYR
ncbi:MAG: 30S ribosomal protein S9 [Candidatus Hadarchaeia archaeon]